MSWKYYPEPFDINEPPPPPPYRTMSDNIFRRSPETKESIARGDEYEKRLDDYGVAIRS